MEKASLLSVVDDANTASQVLEFLSEALGNGQYSDKGLQGASWIADFAIEKIAGVASLDVKAFSAGH